MFCFKNTPGHNLRNHKVSNDVVIKMAAIIQFYKSYISETIYPIALISTPNHTILTSIYHLVTSISSQTAAIFLKIQDGGHSILQALYIRNYLSNRSHSNTRPHYIGVDLSPGNSHFFTNCRHLVF